MLLTLPPESSTIMPRLSSGDNAGVLHFQELPEDARVKRNRQHTKIARKENVELSKLWKKKKRTSTDIRLPKLLAPSPVGR